jgi:hypothetical protein
MWPNKLGSFKIRGGGLLKPNQNIISPSDVRYDFISCEHVYLSKEEGRWHRGRGQKRVDASLMHFDQSFNQLDFFHYLNRIGSHYSYTI